MAQSSSARKLPDPRASRLPMYAVIADELGARIDAGELAPDAPLPSERELSERWEVARMTVRQALGLLERRGLIYRRHGAGTFVSPPKLIQDAARLRGFFEQTIEQGAVPASRIVSAKQVPATRSMAYTLALHVGDPVFEVVRLRSVRGEPVVLETSFFPAGRFPRLLDHDLASRSIYRLMDEYYGGRPTSANQIIEAVAVRTAESALLHIPVGSIVLRLERTSSDKSGRPVEYAIDLYRADRTRFVTHLTL